MYTYSKKLCTVCGSELIFQHVMENPDGPGGAELWVCENDHYESHVMNPPDETNDETLEVECGDCGYPVYSSGCESCQPDRYDH